MDKDQNTIALRERVRSLRSRILLQDPQSELTLLSETDLERMRQDYPTMPEHLLVFCEEFGAGCIGYSRYMLYPLIDPDEVYDEITAKELAGVVLIGDDFAGTVDGYDTNSDEWRFGSINSTGRFIADDHDRTIIDLLEKWFASKD